MHTCINLDEMQRLGCRAAAVEAERAGRMDTAVVHREVMVAYDGTGGSGDLRKPGWAFRILW